jgi:GNAT superfamily N-acetyltransferase
MSDELLEEFFSGMATQHEIAMGEKEHICKFQSPKSGLWSEVNIRPATDLEVVATYETVRRRGYGTILLELGNKLADEMDYPLYLDSEKDAKGLYLKVGYHELTDIAKSSPLAPLMRPRRSERDAL